MSHYEERLSIHYKKIAGEAIQVRFISDHIYFLGSELATLRLFKYFVTTGSNVKDVIQNKSQLIDLGESYYFCVPMTASQRELFMN